MELLLYIGMLLFAQARPAEALHVLEPLHEDLCLVYGPTDEMTAGVAETLAVICLDANGPGTSES
ncbi:hypothetical protein ACFUMJ_14300 [Streptomyces olivaceus]|uniref:hypothetical protein n=1 Tax=Streptomyces TaxID=1883 RepID=UPI001FB5B0CA|nr:hypothetical protein [Streptomyces sp. CB09030]UOG80117.1 hypothetical protein L6J92_13330 [Streptomyces sp. CB09030]